MRISNQAAVFLAVAALAFAPAAHAQSKGGRAIGAGLAFAAPSQGLVVNPAVLPETNQTSLEALWKFKVNDPYVSLSGEMGAIGFAADYQQVGDLNRYQAGFGAKLQILSVGATLRTDEFRDTDADVGVNVDLTKIRLAFVARGLKNGPDRLDGGIGVKIDPLLISFDAKKQSPFGSSTWLFDASVAVAVEKISFGMGYDFLRDASGFHEGDLHAGLSLNVQNELFIEAMYRPLAQEWTVDKWTAGIRYVF